MVAACVKTSGFDSWVVLQNKDCFITGDTHSSHIWNPVVWSAAESMHIGLYSSRGQLQLSWLVLVLIRL